MDSPGKNTGVCCYALLQGIFPTQGWNPGLPNCRQILYRLSHHTKTITSHDKAASTSAATQAGPRCQQIRKSFGQLGKSAIPTTWGGLLLIERLFGQGRDFPGSSKETRELPLRWQWKPLRRLASVDTSAAKPMGAWAFPVSSQLRDVAGRPRPSELSTALLPAVRDVTAPGRAPPPAAVARGCSQRVS